MNEEDEVKTRGLHSSSSSIIVIIAFDCIPKDDPPVGSKRWIEKVSFSSYNRQRENRISDHV